MLKKALSLFGVILETVTTIQRIIPGAPGASKKALVLAIVETAAKEAGKVGEIVDSHETQLIAALIDTAVRSLKTLGAVGFQPSAAPALPPPPAL